MNIEVIVYQCLDCRGEARNVGVKARIETSPSEGYSLKKLAELERDLGPYIEDRLKDALKGGEE